MQAFAALVGGGTALSTCTCSVRELVRGPRWASEEQVAAVDRRGAELDDDLARAGDGVVDLLEAEGAALADDHCLHGSDRMALSPPGASGGGGAGLRPAGADARGRSEPAPTVRFRGSAGWPLLAAQATSGSPGRSLE